MLTHWHGANVGAGWYGGLGGGGLGLGGGGDDGGDGGSGSGGGVGGGPGGGEQGTHSPHVARQNVAKIAGQPACSCAVHVP